MTLDSKIFKQIDEEAYIDNDVIDRINLIENDSLLHDDTWKVDENEADVNELRHISELYRISENMEKRELLTICSVAVRKHPFSYLQVLAEFIIEILMERKGRK